MKKIMLSVVLVLGIIASASASDLVQLVAAYSCTMNKSEILDVHVMKQTGSSDTEVFLGLKNWNESEYSEEIILRNANVVMYGGNTIILADKGRSGYALIRIAATKEENAFNAQLDLNLFLTDRMHTRGLRSDVYCYTVE